MESIKNPTTQDYISALERMRENLSFNSQNLPAEEARTKINYLIQLD